MTNRNALHLLAVFVPVLICFSIGRGGAKAHETTADETNRYSSPGPSGQASHRPTYLMLVTFAVPVPRGIGSDNFETKLSVFAASPYDALAVPVADAYDAGPAPGVQDLLPMLMKWRRAANKDIWPWVFLNRLVGAGTPQINPNAKTARFSSIRGLDLEDRFGAKSSFLETWRTALRLAKRVGSPGIVLDLEYYNNYPAYDISRLAGEIGHGPDQTVQLLSALGSQMADIAAKELPNGRILCFNTGLANASAEKIGSKSYYASRSYIALGLMERIRQGRLVLHLIAGGENSLGYCQESVAELERRIRDRQKQYAPLLNKFANILSLGGTITLWGDASAKKGWLAQEECGRASAQTVEELEPYLKILIHSYALTWIYGAGVSDYDPFQAQTSLRFNRTISRARHSP